MKLMVLLSIVCIAGVAQSQSLQQNYPVNWPSGYEPGKSKFFVHNEIEIAAAPEKVWAILVEAVAWPNWYEGAHDVVISEGSSTALQQNSVFTWKTMGLHFTSTIKEFEPASRLSWESKKKSIQGYHAWVIIPTATGCRVITDESQNGWLTFFEKTFQGKKLKRLHDVWLTALKAKSEQS
ncbi:MAG: SRPBCC domain-containing protein [Cyclobacteriaceae bacterium]|nr:SRPBCC domain-containing protein [Cyclobacteriaceae bacterium]